MDDLPTNKTAEMDALRALMRGGRQVRADTAGALRPEMFYHFPAVARAALRIQAQGDKPDPETVASESGAEGAVMKIAQRTTPPANGPRYARAVEEAWVQRTYFQRLSQFAGEALEGQDVKALRDEVERFALQMSRATAEGDPTPISEIVPDALEMIRKEEEAQGVPGIPTGFDKLDDLTGGWKDATLNIIAARTSQGKTALTLRTCLEAAKAGHPVLYVSLEMGRKQLTRRLIAQEAKVRGQPDSKYRPEEREKIERATERFQSLPFYIEDSGGMDAYDVMSEARRMKSSAGVELVAVDYHQNMKPLSGHDQRYEWIGESARLLKKLAKDEEIAVLLVSQVGRSAERRSNKRPQLSDLRQAGEDDADRVITIYRPEEYGITTDEMGNSTEGKAEITVAKHRNGPTGYFDLAFVEKSADFQPLESHRTTPNGTPNDHPF